MWPPRVRRQSSAATCGGTEAKATSGGAGVAAQRRPSPNVQERKLSAYTWRGRGERRPWAHDAPLQLGAVVKLVACRPPVVGEGSGGPPSKSGANGREDLGDDRPSGRAGHVDSEQAVRGVLPERGELFVAHPQRLERRDRLGGHLAHHHIHQGLPQHVQDLAHGDPAPHLLRRGRQRDAKALLDGIQKHPGPRELFAAMAAPHEELQPFFFQGVDGGRACQRRSSRHTRRCHRNRTRRKMSRRGPAPRPRRKATAWLPVTLTSACAKSKAAGAAQAQASLRLATASAAYSPTVGTR